MIILGVSISHNASAALMVDGKLVALLQEERLTKRKNQTGFPRKSITEIVQTHLDGDFGKIDKVIEASFYHSVHYIANDRYSNYGVPEFIEEMKEYWWPFFYGDKNSVVDYWKNRYLKGIHVNKDHNYNFSFISTMKELEIQKHFNEIERKKVYLRFFDYENTVKYVDHHTCHAYYAYYGSNKNKYREEDSIIFTADAWGDGRNWTVWLPGKDGKLIFQDGGMNQEVARIYKFVTLILGMKPNEHEYKVMGLAPYSKSRRHIDVVVKILSNIHDFSDGEFISKYPLKDRYFDLRERLEGQRFDNIAAGLQEWATSVTKKWIVYWLDKTDRKVVYFSGGLSMNIKTNGDLLSSNKIKDLFVPASGGDESLSAGAAYFAAAHTKAINITPLKHVYLGGVPLPDDEDWTNSCVERGLDISTLDTCNNVTAVSAARLLADGQVVARCIGRGEFGARSLGNRSVLASPSSRDIVAHINDSIKNRDFWMPFAPSILAEYANNYCINPKKVESPYMTVGFDTVPEFRDNLVAALHPSDLSARPQFVYQDTNPDYWSLIDAFRKLTGIPALLNTSLNIHGEPVNYDVVDAVSTLLRSKLFFLLIPGGRLIYKKEASKIIDRALTES